MWKEIRAEELKENTFSLIGTEWMLVGAEKDGKVNAMTASWGGLGVLWGKKVAFVFIRPQRYTKEFIDARDTFSLSFFGEGNRKMLNYMGTVSGREEDKIAVSGLHAQLLDGAPVFEESRMTMICRKLYAQTMEEGCFLVDGLAESNYAQKDFHTTYVVEIEKILVRE